MWGKWEVGCGVSGRWGVGWGDEREGRTEM